MEAHLSISDRRTLGTKAREREKGQRRENTAQPKIGVSPEGKYTTDIDRSWINSRNKTALEGVSVRFQFNYDGSKTTGDFTSKKYMLRIVCRDDVRRR